MKVKIKRIDKSLPLPVYETNGAAGFDLLARVETTVKPGEIALIPANIIVETPEDYMLVLASRSSSPKKKGLTMPHGIGILDSDYSGNGDEVMIQVYNFAKQEALVTRGEKIAQGIFVPVSHATWHEIDSMPNKTRGGFGSTDKK